jgi:D-3-phosphoglycerate dehydrogenase
MKKILVSDTLSDQGLDLIRRAAGIELDYRPGLNEADLAAAVKGAHGLVIRSGSSVTARVIEAANCLEVIGRAGIGVDNVDVPAASKRGIVVMNTPTGNAVTTAEHAIALMMSLARHIPQATASMRAGRWDKKKLAGRELAGKTLAVVGLGTIGRIVADRGRGLKMRVIAFDPVLTEERAADLGVELVGLETIWREADVITVHTPLTPQTKGLVNDEVVAKLKKGVLLVNCARGGIYDEAAVLRGLESGHIGGCALDVFPVEPPPADTPILQHDRVIATPHLGASTDEAQERVSLEIVEQVIAYLKTGAVENGINAPSMSSEVAAKLAPWAELAGGLGRFLAQAEPTDTAAIEVECVGALADLDPRPLVSSALAGFLRHFLNVPVNAVSAPHLAADRGLRVTELRSHEGSGKHPTQIVVRAIGKDGDRHEIAGSLGSDRSPRLVRWRDFDIDARLEGSALVVESLDKPGVIGFMGSTLGDAGINVTSLYLGRSSRGKALSIWSLDEPLAPEALATMIRSENVERALIIEL